MSVSPIGLDLFPWLIFVCIHFPGVFSWISPVTLRTCIQCWWQKNRNQNQQETSEGWRCSCLKCVFKMPHKCFMHFISYIAEYFLKSEIYNCKNPWLYKNRRKLLFFLGRKKFKVLETIIVQFNVSGWGFYIIFPSILWTSGIEMLSGQWMDIFWN